jgi:hypothetical protein
MSVAPSPARPATPWLAFAQLVRLPNAFTAMADICLGAIVTGALPGQFLPFVLLLLSSTSLYWAGMVWNDYFDLEQDRRERPFRPLPSGRISLATARGLGIGLLAAGVLLAGLADWGEEGLRWHSLPLAVGLAAAILVYDGGLKRTWAGPVVMGTCRFLNVLLGLSVVSGGTGTWGLAVALVVGLYIIGVTWFARTEARLSNQNALTAAAGLMLAAFVLALAVPELATDAGINVETSFFFPYLLVGLGFYLGSWVVRAILHPGPTRVQAAVKRLVLGLIALDAVLATALAGLPGLLLLALLLPALYLGRWLYST